MSLLFGSASIESKAANLGLLVLRAGAGLSMAFGHGLGKVPPSDRLIEGTANLGFPMPGFFAWAAASSEFFGGLFIALGLLTRPSAFFLGCTMFVAAFLQHAADPFARKEKALLFLFISVAILLIGGGRYAVDALVRKSEAVRRQT